MRLTANRVQTTPRRDCAVAACAALLLAAAPARAVELSPGSRLSVAYLYTLADANGPLPMSWVRLAHDARAHETFVFDPSDGMVHVFSRSGIETFSFGDDEALGSVTDVAVLESGDLVLLSYLRGKLQLLRCNFRGEPLARIEVKGAPADLADFSPSTLRAAGGLLYLADALAMRVLAIAPDGAFVRSYDARAVMGKKVQDAGFTGFAVDRHGNVLFTVAPLFQAFVLSPEGALQGFGVRGSSPGKFNVIAGIAADEAGNLYVVDVLRSVVMVFDAAFVFQGEFGYRGADPGNLVSPRDLVVGDGQVFVSQSAARGVSVFRIEPPPAPSPSSTQPASES